MDKRVAKRHKRQVSRAKLNANTSQPDVRTREQIEAARNASSPVAGRGRLANLVSAVRSKLGGSKKGGNKAES